MRKRRLESPVPKLVGLVTLARPHWVSVPIDFDVLLSMDGYAIVLLMVHNDTTLVGVRSYPF